MLCYWCFGHECIGWIINLDLWSWTMRRIIRWCRRRRMKRKRKETHTKNKTQIQIWNLISIKYKKYDYFLGCIPVLYFNIIRFLFLLFLFFFRYYIAPTLINVLYSILLPPSADMHVYFHGGSVIELFFLLLLLLLFLLVLFLLGFVWNVWEEM